MRSEIMSHISEIPAICRRYGVARLDLFGSATGDQFSTETSDVDLVVEFLPEARAHAFDNYFGLLESLERVFGRRVDLVTDASVRNPFMRRAIDESRQPLNGA